MVATKSLTFILATNLDRVTYHVRQFSHLLLVSIIVIGTLMIIPAIVQTAAAYVWARQCKKMRIMQGQVQVSKIPNDYDKNLFLYRLVACISSLLVIVLESGPRLYILITKTHVYTEVHKVIMVNGTAARFFATYLIVIPFVMFFWNYVCVQKVNRRHLVIKNIFRAIVWSSLPICVVGYTISTVCHLLLFNKYLTFSYFYTFDIILHNFIPSLVILTLTIVFIMNLDKNEYGIFYEPLTFLALNFCYVLCNLILFCIFLISDPDKILGIPFFDTLYIAYVLYHMSFSGNFVMATIHSVISEIQADRRKRALAFSDDVPNEEDSGSRRRNDIISNMQKQFNIAYRWQTNASDQSNLGDDDEADYLGSDCPEDENGQPETTEAKGKRIKTLEDVTMHYNILKNSNHLQKPQKERKKRSIIDFY